MILNCFLVLAVRVLDAGACGGVSHHTNFGQALAPLIVTSFENASENQLRPVCWPIEVRRRSAGALLLRARSIDGSPPSRTLQPIDDTPVWAITCLYVAKGDRRQGLTRRLIQAGSSAMRTTSTKGKKRRLLGDAHFHDSDRRFFFC
jgi:hypothetical protein